HDDIGAPATADGVAGDCGTVDLQVTRRDMDIAGVAASHRERDDAAVLENGTPPNLNVDCEAGTTDGVSRHGEDRSLVDDELTAADDNASARTRCAAHVQQGAIRDRYRTEPRERR